jgi:ubiquinone biosynthesis O-methyltransferase
MKNLKELYNHWHDDVAKAEDKNSLHLCRWHYEAIKLCNDISGRKVLEAGCGRGDFSIYLSQKSAYVDGFDFSEAAIEIAKKKALFMNAIVNFFVANAQDLPIENDLYDIIFSCECLEHLPDPQKALNEFYRVLKPGGLLVLTTENYSNGMIIPWIKSWVTRKPFNSGDEVQPIENFFLYWEVKKMMEKSGFIVKKVTGWHYVFLILPRNKNLIKEDIQNKNLKSFLKPFARHMSFLLVK